MWVWKYVIWGFGPQQKEGQLCWSQGLRFSHFTPCTIWLVHLFSFHLEMICRLQVRKLEYACAQTSWLLLPILWLGRSVEVGARAGETRAFTWLQAEDFQQSPKLSRSTVSFKWQAAPPGAIARGMEVEGLFPEDLGIMASSGTGLSRSHSTHCLHVFMPLIFHFVRLLSHLDSVDGHPTGLVWCLAVGSTGSGSCCACRSTRRGQDQTQPELLSMALQWSSAYNLW